MQQTACLMANPVTINSFAALFKFHYGRFNIAVVLSSRPHGTSISVVLVCSDILFLVELLSVCDVTIR